MFFMQRMQISDFPHWYSLWLSGFFCWLCKWWFIPPTWTRGRLCQIIRKHESNQFLSSLFSRLDSRVGVNCFYKSWSLRPLGLRSAVLYRKPAQLHAYRTRQPMFLPEVVLLHPRIPLLTINNFIHKFHYMIISIYFHWAKYKCPSTLKQPKVCTTWKRTDKHQYFEHKTFNLTITTFSLQNDRQLMRLSF